MQSNSLDNVVSNAWVLCYQDGIIHPYNNQTVIPNEETMVVGAYSEVKLLHEYLSK